MTDIIQQGAVQTLVHDMGLTEANVERRKKIVGIEATDVAQVQGLKEVVTAHSAELVDVFFKHLSGLEEARALMTSRNLLERARQLKRDHLIGLVSGEYGSRYMAQRVELAMIYARTGLEATVFLAAFQRMLSAVALMAFKREGGNTLVSTESFLALQKIAFVDLGVMVDVLVFERERIIRQQQEAIRELSTPVLQIRDRLLLLPIIGVIDTHRARLITDSLLKAIRTARAKAVVVDVTGVATIDSRVANHLLQTVTAARLMGAAVIVTGITSDVAQSLVALGIELSKLNTAGDLQGGLEEAERLLGLSVSRSSADATPLARGS